MTTLDRNTFLLRMQHAMQSQTVGLALFNFLNYITGAGGSQTDLVLDDATELTIDAAGAIQVTQGSHKVDTFGDAASDNLDDIAGMDEEEFLLLRPESAARTVVIRSNAVGGGNIYTPGEVSIPLAEATDWALIVSDGTNAIVIAASCLAGTPPSIALASASLLVGNAAGIAAAAAMSGDGVISNAGVFGARHVVRLAMPVLGPWAVDGDGARTNGGGLVGQVPILTNAGAAYCKVYDIGTTTFANCALSGGLAGWAANFQLTADAASEEIGDAFYLGNDLPFCEVAFDLSALATYTGDAGLYEYWDGSAWQTLATTLYDNTDTTAQDGLRPLQQVGAMVFQPPADWATTTVDGQLAYWIRWRVTAAQITQTPILNTVQHDVVSGEDPWIPPHNMSVERWIINDNAATLHTTADVIFIIFDETTGAFEPLTFAQDSRVQRFASSGITALTTASRLSVFVVQEDGAAEPSGVIIEIEGTYSA